ncbi:MAG: Hsp20/alpha crystallin family protein [Pseudomonadota bacterium]
MARTQRVRLTPLRRPGAPGVMVVHPIALFEQMRRQMDDVFGRMQRDEDQHGDDESGHDHDGDDDPQRSLAQSKHSPAVDFEEDDDAYHLSIELPGVKRENLDVSISSDVLKIEAEKKSRREKKDDEGPSVRERQYGRFSRSIRLPDNVNGDDIEADYADGVLELTLL